MPRLALIMAALALAACGSGESEAPRPKRIILFSMDTVRSDHVSGYGGVDATPRLEEIAAEGTRFERFYAASSYTIPSHMSIFTGLDPVEHGVERLDARLAPEVLTLAERLRSAGYTTQAFRGGGFMAPRFGFDRGFASYTEVPRLWLVREGLPAVLDWMRAQEDRRYFLFLHTYAAHFPYGGYERYRAEHPERGLPAREELHRLSGGHPDPEGRGRSVSGSLRLLCSVVNQFVENPPELLECGPRHLPASFTASPHFELDRAEMLRSYQERIELVDRAIGAIRDELVARGHWDDTLLIVTADHGEAFFEHAGLSNHGYVPFDEVLRVPLIVSYPRFLREGGVRVVGDLAWHLDLLPTVLGFAGVPVPTELRGRDLRDDMRGRRSQTPERAVFPAVMRPPTLSPLPLRRVAISGPLKWIDGHEAFGDSKPMLFDLASDPGERENRCGRDAEACGRLEASAREWERGLQPHAPVDSRTGARLSPTGQADPGPDALPPAEREQLRALGYVE